MRNVCFLLAAALLAAGPARAAPGEATEPAGAATEPAGAEAGKPAASADEVRALAEEVRKLKLEIAIPEVEIRSYSGLGPAASKVYYASKGLSIGGYGELTYENQLQAGTDQSDLRRVVLYAGYRFSPLVVFNAEIEFEHAGKEVHVEFAYLDLLFTRSFRLRVGSLLLPVGIINEMHEPAFYAGVNRPEPERVIIPTTWNENGVGAHGELGRLRYKAYLVTGLDPIAGQASAGSWLRGARSEGGESRAESWAGVLALSGDLGPVTLGGSFYRGGSGQGEKAADGSAIRGTVTLAEGHALLAWRGLGVRALGVRGTLGDAGAISTRLGLSGDQVLGSRVVGAYAEASYDLLPLLLPGSEQSLAPFVRYEYLDLHAGVPAGGIRDPALETDAWVGGLTWKLLPTVVLKADVQRKQARAAGSSAREQLNLGAGFVF